MSQTPIYEEVRRALGRADRTAPRRGVRDDDAGDHGGRGSRPIMLRGNGGRHRRTGV